MEKRIGVIAILVQDKASIPKLNAIISSHCDIVLGRQGMPLRDRRVNVISLIVEGTTDQIGAATGKIGRLPGVQVKSVLTNYKEDGDDRNSATA
ncbi:MAG: iron-only hydrogenase system regulator [Acidobacteriota bacterium]|jgi:putative iron-only hydrogenase system regulator|nr:iron-only hydrogenase system regulator [Acidobacteriota bacterium]